MQERLAKAAKQAAPSRYCGSWADRTAERHQNSTLLVLASEDWNLAAAVCQTGPTQLWGDQHSAKSARLAHMDKDDMHETPVARVDCCILRTGGANGARHRDSLLV
jgi:hypothetical protein